MKTYDVTVRATVTKTLRVIADTEDEAREFAHGEFSTTPDDAPEKYDEEIINLVEVVEQAKAA